MLMLAALCIVRPSLLQCSCHVLHFHRLILGLPHFLCSTAKTDCNINLCYDVSAEVPIKFPDARLIEIKSNCG